MSRRFNAGDEFYIDGLRLRIASGGKEIKRGPRAGEYGHDLVIEWLSLDERKWVRMRFAVLALLVDFLCENEDVLYPPEHGFRGGEMLLANMRTAKERGHLAAIAEVEGDQAALRARKAKRSSEAAA